MGNNAHIHTCAHCEKKFRGRKAYREHLHGAVVRERGVPSTASASGYALVQTIVKGCLEMREGTNTKFKERVKIVDPVETPLSAADRRVLNRLKMAERKEARNYISNAYTGRRLAKLAKEARA